MTQRNEHGQYFCEQCTARYDRVGDCSDCDGEPLLDLGDDEVRRMIADFDDARWRKRAGLWMVVSIAVMFPFTVALLALFGGTRDLVREILFVAAIGTVGLAGVLSKRFAPPRRLPELTEEELAKFAGR